MKLKIFTFVTGLLIALCAQAQTSGPAGPLTWSYDAGTKTLSITGTGDMPDYSDTSPQPWEAYRNNALTVTIGEGVTRIGNDAFVGFISLQNITLPTSLSSIGSYAFLDCSALQNIALNEGITTIEKRAFESCTALQSITLPASVTSIGNSPFLSCKSIKNINVSPSNMQYASQDGILYNKAMTELLRYPPGKSGMTFSVPVQVSTVGEFAFEYCTELQSLTFPESVTFIGFLAFDQCTALTTINVDGSNTHYTSIDGILYNKAKTQILCYPSRKSGTAFVVPDGITFIGNKAFANNTALQSINLPSSLTSIGYMAFHDCVELKSILLPASIQSFGQWTFSRCTALKEISVMWDTPLPVDPSIFSGVPLSAATLKVPAGKKALYQTASVWKDFGTITEGTATPPASVNYDFKDGQLFYKKTSANTVKVVTRYEYVDSHYPTELSGVINIPSTVHHEGVGYYVTSLADSVFWNCKNITKITLSDTIREIERSAFEGCIKLTSITLSKSIRSLPMHLFYGCILLNEVIVSWDTPPTISSPGIFTNVPLSAATLKVPAGKKALYQTASVWKDFGTITEGTAVSGPAGPLTWSYDAGTKTLSITGTGAMPDYFHDTQPWKAYQNEIQTVTIGEGVSTIGNNAFSSFEALQNITIPSSVTKFGARVFADCNALQSFTKLYGSGHHHLDREWVF